MKKVTSLIAGLALTIGLAGSLVASVPNDWNCGGILGDVAFVCYGDSTALCQITTDNGTVACKGTKMVVDIL